MYRREMNAQSPLRILERSIRGGFCGGSLGVVMGPAGVGKSACLVQIGLDHQLRDEAVLHLAVGQTVEHVSARYETLFDDLADLVELKDREVRESIGYRRLIKAVAQGAFAPDGLHQALSEFEALLELGPSAILIDGYDWNGPGCTAALSAIKAAARRVGAELWMTARTPPDYDARPPQPMTPGCAGCAALIDVGLLLAPHGDLVEVRLMKDFDEPSPAHVRLSLHSDTLRRVKDGGLPSVRVPARSFTLLATGTLGAEAEFGACAERWGVKEVNFTFRGRDEPVRERGLVELRDEELELGKVSSVYLRAHMHRTYPASPAFQRVLQAIWHQVSAAGEVFSVGTTLPDETAQGGTGWAVELARHWGKPVHMFDEERKRWFVWKNREWSEELPPIITRERFAGAGTRTLSADGEAAIHALFERSFGVR